MGAVTTLLDLVYPPRCVFCHGFVRRREGLVCPECRDHTLPYAGKGGERHGDFFEVCVFPLYYKENVRASLHRYKFDGRDFYAKHYGPFLADCIRDNLSGRYDIFSWVPLSRKRLRDRGYDQSKLLAEAAAQLLGETVTPTLEKFRDTPKQSQAGAEEKRRANIAGAYRVVDPERVAGRRILLVDDIVTTGSTLSECAGTLRSAGAAAVVCAALAGTEN